MPDSPTARPSNDHSRPPVLVAVTDRRETRHAVELGVQMARMLATDLVIGAVTAPSVHPIRATLATLEVDPISPSEREELFEAQARMLALGVPSDVLTTVDVIASATPGRGLARLAARHVPLLMVLGASHRGELGVLLSADPTLDLLRHTSCPVLVVPSEGDRALVEVPRTVGIAWDLSLEADAALAVGLDLAGRAHASARILHVLRPEVPLFMPPADPPIGPELETVRRGEAERALAEAVAAHPPAVELEMDFRDGAVAHELTGATSGLDLLVVGSRRAGPMLRLVAGSVSSHLVAHSQCPVLIVPRGTSLPVPANLAAAVAR